MTQARARQNDRRLLAGAAAALSLTLACATLPVPATDVKYPTWVVRHTLPGGTLDLHLIKPVKPIVSDRIVLYVTGDGGWFNAAIDMFNITGALGYPVVGFSARSFMPIVSRGGRYTLRTLAEDYHSILVRARRELGLPEATPAILTGWSHGASLAVVAGNSRALQAEIAGVLVTGLPPEEKIQTPSEETDLSFAALSQGGDRRMYDTYLLIDHITYCRTGIVQSTGDGYLKAGDAQPRFGPDSAHRRFFAVPAKSHAFRGGEVAFVERFREALDWVATAPPR